MFLNMASVNDIGAFAGVNFGSHFFYGNLENKFSALNKVFEKKDFFKKSVEKKTVDDFQRYLATCEKCLDEIDRLIAMTGLITIFNDSSNLQEVTFAIRLRAFVLRDLTGDVLEDFRRSKGNAVERNFHTSDLEKLAKLLTEEVNAVFQGRKKLVDSIVKHDRIRWVVGLFVTLPYIVIRRWISIKICRLRKIPYQDPDYPSYAAFLLKEWRNKHGFSLEEAAKILEMSKNDYRDVEYGYRQPNFEHWEIIVKKHLRGEVVYTKPDKIKGNA